MKETEVLALLKKYRDKNCSREELAFLDRWYESREGNGIAELSETEFKEDLLYIAKGLPLYTPALQKRRVWPQMASVAAAAAVLVLGFILYTYTPFFGKPKVPLQLTTLSVPADQQRQLTLADGSTIWVNAGSKVGYPKQFDGKTREVYLSGEAYFDIKQDPDKPFIIHTGKLKTTVLGTAFNIKEDPQSHRVTVTVTQGKVSVANGTEVLGIIKPNQQISFNTAENKFALTNVDAMKAIEWQKTGLRFEDISFADAAIKLEQRFKLNISFENKKLQNCRFTGTALNGENLDQILKVICSFNKASYVKQPDGSILIKGEGCE
ncbi:FecR family protein [Pedobacter caeni]|uniref:FecR family protein n=1 Tax=Pedobacter caeni TaxID=288992 RepID=A0A1M5AU84_9SPHI|nr:FecR family protein [Pedobacter caeni]SHF33809.1 FecR family protein [Pedobacter caeni]